MNANLDNTKSDLLLRTLLESFMKFKLHPQVDGSSLITNRHTQWNDFDAKVIRNGSEWKCWACYSDDFGNKWKDGPFFTATSLGLVKKWLNNHLKAYERNLTNVS